MASVQEMDSRLRSIEDRVKFIMTTMKGQIVEPTGMLDQTGRAVLRQRQVSMEDLFLQSRRDDVDLVEVTPKELEKVESNG